MLSMIRTLDVFIWAKSLLCRNNIKLWKKQVFYCTVLQMSGGIFMKMYDILRKSAIRTKIKASNKKQLLQDIANMASEHVGIPSMNIAKSLQQREILGPTGIGNGVAIPHIKMRGLTKICGFFSSLERPIDFESADKQPVDLIFTILAPENNTGTEHLKALAMVSRFFSDKDIRSKLRSSENAESLFAILTSSEDSKAA